MNIPDLNAVFSMLAVFQQMAHHSYDAFKQIEQITPLSPAGRRALSAGKQSAMHTNRICNIYNYLFDTSSGVDIKKLESFEIKTMMKEIIFRFENIVSTFNNVSVSFKSNLEEDSLITISKTHFELIILNLLYCAVKNSPEAAPRSVKISISVTENKEHIIFRISDDNQYPDGCDIQRLLSDAPYCFGEIDINSPSGMIGMSVKVVQKSVLEMNGKLTYTQLKNGNRFDVHLPKDVRVPTYTMCSPVRYTPSFNYFNEIFADLRLEYILSASDEAYADRDEGVMWP